MKVTIEAEYPISLGLTSAEAIARAFAEAGISRSDYLVCFDSMTRDNFGAVHVKIVATKKKLVTKK